MNSYKSGDMLQDRCPANVQLLFNFGVSDKSSCHLKCSDNYIQMSLVCTAMIVCMCMFFCVGEMCKKGKIQRNRIKTATM